MIELKNVVKSYGNQKVLDVDSLKFEDNKTYMIYGPSGMGKSTLLNIISGVKSEDKGEVIVNGVDITKLTQIEKDNIILKEVGYIFQNFKLLENMTLKDNLELLNIELKGLESYIPILDKVGLSNKINSKVRELSGGEKQRLAICRAIYKKPSVILADEPTGNLNSKIAREIMELLVKLSKETSSTLIVVSHDMTMLELFDETIDITTICGGNYNV